ncbi:MAG: sortase [Rubrobacter sp.]|nr:sortase [Rubrobacter sp.]
MRPRGFGSWTRTEGERTVYYRSWTWRRLGRWALAFAGLVLILGAVGVVFSDVRTADKAAEASAPKDETMTLTVPKMRRVRNIPVYNAPASNEAALHDGTLHVEGTGFPWQDEANVYIAGHRLGYPRTDSFLVFYDLNKLRNGNRVVLKDTEDRKYIYKVFHRKVVSPHAKKVLDPLPGKNVVTLQTCTLPNYTRRLLIQAKLERVIAKKPRPAQASANKTG